MGQKQKTERKKEEEERLNDGDNNGQATHGAHKHAWRKQAAWSKLLTVHTVIHIRVLKPNRARGTIK